MQEVQGTTVACHVDLASLINYTKIEAAPGNLPASCPHACACHHLSLSKNLICTPTHVSIAIAQMYRLVQAHARGMQPCTLNLLSWTRSNLHGANKQPLSVVLFCALTQTADLSFQKTASVICCFLCAMDHKAGIQSSGQDSIVAFIVRCI